MRVDNLAFIKQTEKLIIFHSAQYIAPYWSANINAGSYARYHLLQIMNNVYQKNEEFVGRNALRPTISIAGIT
jgi:hypothetical protein